MRQTYAVAVSREPSVSNLDAIGAARHGRNKLSRGAVILGSSLEWLTIARREVFMSEQLCFIHSVGAVVSNAYYTSS